MTEDDPRHGTTAGYQAETNANIPHCPACKAARAHYQRHREYDNALGRPRKLPAIGARRRVRALQRLGWSLTMIANEAGWNSPEALQYVMRSESVTRKSWLRIAAAYDELSMKIPPYNSATARARARAARLGYPPPLAWNDIDDHREQPRGAIQHTAPTRTLPDLATVDPIAVQRILSGEWKLPSTPPEKAEVCRRWAENGGSLAQLHQLTGWRISRYFRKDAA